MTDIGIQLKIGPVMTNTYGVPTPTTTYAWHWELTGLPTDLPIHPTAGHAPTKTQAITQAEAAKTSALDIINNPEAIDTWVPYDPEG